MDRPRCSGEGKKRGEMSEMEKKMNGLKAFVEKGNKGALSTYLIGPIVGLTRIAAHVRWDGEKEDNAAFGPLPWMDQGNGYVPVTHAAFGRCGLCVPF